MSKKVNYSNLAKVEGADNYKEAAIILDGPPIQIFGQRAGPTTVLRPLQQASGRFYYECQTDTGGYMQLGWADQAFKASADDGKGAGDDAHSWAFDGHRCLKWHNNIKKSYGRNWKPGDTVGMAVDLNERCVTFYLNGESLGVAFENINFIGSVFPCISLIRGERISLRLGLSDDDEFNFPLPSGYSSLTITDQQCSVGSEDRYSSSSTVIKMGMSESSFVDSFPGQIMVTVMGRGLAYEAKKNGIVNAGYEATVQRYESCKSQFETQGAKFALTKDELMALICYTLEKPPIYRFFNKDTREGFTGDGNDFPIINYLLNQGCKKILRATNPSDRTKVVYRGVSVPFSAHVGDKIRFGAYTSTSASPQKANVFLKNTSGTTFTITTKLGAGIKLLSVYPDEEEVLIPPFEVFRVTNVEGTQRIYCESETTDEYLRTYLS